MKTQNVKYGDTIRIKHTGTNHYLASINKTYFNPGSSGQQIIICRAIRDSESLWIVGGPDGNPPDFRGGTPVGSGEIIRLTHLNTKKNLHSHSDRQSPVARQQEVTGYGSIGTGNSDDNWQIMTEGDQWEIDKPFRLLHKTSNKLLRSQLTSPSNFVNNEQEVTCYASEDSNSLWLVAAKEQDRSVRAFSSQSSKFILDVLNLVGAIASITGWSFLTLRTIVSGATIATVLSIITSILLVIGSVSLLMAFTIPSIQNYYSRRPSQFSWLGVSCLLIVAGIILIFGVLWLIPFLAANPIGWLFRSLFQ